MLFTWSVTLQSVAWLAVHPVTRIMKLNKIILYFFHKNFLILNNRFRTCRCQGWCWIRQPNQIPWQATYSTCRSVVAARKQPRAWCIVLRNEKRRVCKPSRIKTPPTVSLKAPIQAKNTGKWFAILRKPEGNLQTNRVLSTGLCGHPWIWQLQNRQQAGSRKQAGKHQ